VCVVAGRWITQVDKTNSITIVFVKLGNHIIDILREINANQSTETDKEGMLKLSPMCKGKTISYDVIWWNGWTNNTCCIMNVVYINLFSVGGFEFQHISFCNSGG
jgi:hypothetical protein